MGVTKYYQFTTADREAVTNNVEDCVDKYLTLRDGDATEALLAIGDDLLDITTDPSSSQASGFQIQWWSGTNALDYGVGTQQKREDIADRFTHLSWSFWGGYASENDWALDSNIQLSPPLMILGLFSISIH